MVQGLERPGYQTGFSGLPRFLIAGEEGGGGGGGGGSNQEVQRCYDGYNAASLARTTGTFEVEIYQEKRPVEWSTYQIRRRQGRVRP